MGQHNSIFFLKLKLTWAGFFQEINRLRNKRDGKFPTLSVVSRCI